MVTIRQSLLALTLFSTVIASPLNWRLDVKNGDVSNPSPPAVANDASQPAADAETKPQDSAPSTPEKLGSQTGGAISDFAKNHLSMVLLGSMSITYITLL